MTTWLRRQFPTIDAVLTWWRDRLTPIGKAIVACMLCCLPFLVSAESPAVFILSGFLSLFTVSRVAAHLDRPKLSLEASAPRFANRGETFTVELKLSSQTLNRRAPVSGRLIDVPAGWDEMEPFQTIVPANAIASIQVPLTIQRRGVYSFPDVELTYHDPFFIHRCAVRQPVRCQVTVAPRYERRGWRSLGGVGRELQHALRDVLLEDESVGNREYVPGMSVRRWDYASWARLGRPIVREYGTNSRGSMHLVLDTTLPHDRDVTDEPIEEIEAVLSVAASLAALIQRNCTYELATTTPDGHLTLPEQTASHPLNSLLVGLARLPLFATSDLDALATQIQSVRTDSVAAILITHSWTGRHQDMFDEFVRRSPTASAIIVTPTGNGLWKIRRQLRSGCDVPDFDTDVHSSGADPFGIRAECDAGVAVVRV